MLRHSILIAAGIALLSSAAALAADRPLQLAQQFGAPPPGSVFGTESGTYGSSIGTDVRGSTEARIMDPNDPVERSNERKKKDAREAEKERTQSGSRTKIEPGDPRSSPSYNTSATEAGTGSPGPQTTLPSGMPGTTPSTTTGNRTPGTSTRSPNAPR